MDLNELLHLVEAFGAWDLLKRPDKNLFETSRYQDLQQDLVDIQSQREITRAMMNMTRIQPFLTRMAHLEKVLHTIEFQDTAKVMGYVWGPVRFLLKVRFHAISILAKIAQSCSCRPQIPPRELSTECLTYMSS